MKPQEEKIIDIGIGINLPKLLDTRALIQAGSGGGKSWMIRCMAESVGTSVQQIIIDPEGEFSTLREKFPFALVSKDGDIPLSLKYAETIATKLLETNLSAIIDLYELAPDIRILFVKRFLTAMINAPKELWHSCIVYLDESDKFCPEGRPSESGASVINLCAQGRKRGFAAVLATQRLSKLNKDASAELLNKLIGRTGQDIDRKRAGDELGFATKQDFTSLRELEPGEFYAFGPAISNDVKKFKGKKVITTHLTRGNRMVAAPPTPTAIRKILEKLSSIPEEAEKELVTKQQLNDEIKRLSHELAKARREQKPVDEKTISALVQTHTKDIVKKHADEVKALVKEVEKSKQYQLSYLKIIDKAIAFSGELAQLKEKVGVQEPSPHVVFQTSDTNKNYALPVPVKFTSHVVPVNKKRPDSTQALPIGEKKILIACAQYGQGVRRDQLTVLTGYKRSSRDAYIQRLKEKGYLAQDGERLSATPEGIEKLGDDFEPLPMGEALRSYWLQKLPIGEKKILEVLISGYPQDVHREIISDNTGYKRSSRDAYIQRMQSKEIIQVTGNGLVRASNTLFD